MGHGRPRATDGRPLTSTSRYRSICQQAGGRIPTWGAAPGPWGTLSLPPYHRAVALILLAEDDEGIRVPLVRALEREGYEVEAVGTGTDAVATGVDGDHDLLILDIGLPGIDGLEVCQRV